jgi:NAD(P)-dependent dehydrogenase (short-subunit alcohol dehydrogenase family)
VGGEHAGVSLLFERGGGLYWIVAATVGSFLAALVDAWVLLAEIHRWTSSLKSADEEPARLLRERRRVGYGLTDSLGEATFASPPSKASAPMDLELADKVVVVTGASKGIGLAVTRAFVAEGAHVVAGARTVESLSGLERVTAVPVDLLAREGPGRLVQRAIDEHGRVDVLANNVGGVRLRLEGFLGTSDEEFEWAMQINFFAALRATRAAITAMLKQGGGAIVNVASVNAFFQPDGGTVDYGAAKAALVNVTKALSQEFGPRGIRINDVSPGPVSTDLWLGRDGVAQTVARATGVDPETARKNVLASIGGLPTGRMTTPEEVATLVVMLASKRTANVTGANYVIDGGLIKTT